MVQLTLSNLVVRYSVAALSGLCVYRFMSARWYCMEPVTEMVVTVVAILVFVVLLFGVALWWNQTSKRARQQKLNQDQVLKATKAERVLRHKEKLAFAENGLVSAQLELAELDERNGNLKEAAYWFEKAALQDSAEGIAGFVRVCDASATEIVTQGKYRYWRNALKASQGDE